MVGGNLLQCRMIFKHGSRLQRQFAATMAIRSGSQGNAKGRLVQPSRQRCRCPQRRSFAGEHHKRRLKRILRILCVGQHTPADTHHGYPMSLDKFRKRQVTLAFHESSQQSRIGLVVARIRCANLRLGIVAYRQAHQAMFSRYEIRDIGALNRHAHFQNKNTIPGTAADSASVYPKLGEFPNFSRRLGECGNTQ